MDLFYNLGKIGSVWKDGYVIGWPAVWGKELQGPLEKLVSQLERLNTCNADSVSLQFDRVWQMGPQLPAFGLDEWTVETKRGECNLFLDRMLEEAGPKSVVYARQGSTLLIP